MTQYGTWDPYAGTEAVVLAVVLLAIGLSLAYLGTRLKGAVGVRSPGKAVGAFLLLFWVLSLVTFEIGYATYAVQLYQQNMIQAPPTNPITPITEISAAATFVIIAYVTRKRGLKLALGSAFVGTAAAPMVFELPFDLIVMGRTFPPVPPYPELYRLVFFLPLFLVEISTFSLLTLSPLTRISRFTLYSLAGVFFVFAVWATLGFPYPSNPAPFALNGISKILSFAVAITLFLGTNKAVVGNVDKSPVD